MTPERLARIEQRHQRLTGTDRAECLRRGCLTCLFAAALHAAWAERDALRGERDALRRKSDYDERQCRALALELEDLGFRSHQMTLRNTGLRAAITTFTGVLITDSWALLSRRAVEALDALVAVATEETPVVKEGRDG